ncbi:MFS transporter [Streptosporangium sp. NPDC051022]|uniref:MFS transporter n=1 Tax=Streptosporangium sp. NPDC051022 TaxID=3155752 RepID=UPI00343C3C90
MTVTETPRAQSEPVDLPLRRNRRFQALWIGGAGAAMSVNMALVAIPVLVLAVTRSAMVAGLYGLVTAAAAFAAGVPAGAILDRYNRKTLLIVSELVRALAFGTLLLALTFDSLGIVHLLAVAAVTGATQPLSSGARVLATRSVVPPAQLTSALTQEEVRSHSASIIGPALGGMLYAGARTLPIIGIAAGYLISALCAFAVPRDREASEARRAQPSGGMLSGLAILLRSPVLRASIIALSVLNIGGSALDLLVVVLIRNGGGSEAEVGFAFTIVSVGGLAGAALVGLLHRHLRPGMLLIGLYVWAGALTAALAVPLAVTLGFWWYGAVLALAVLPLPAAMVLIDILIFRQVDDALRGRTITATITMLTVGAAFGPFVAGLLLEYAGPVPAVLAVSGIFLTAGVYALSKRVIRTAQWPQPQNAEA